MNDWPDGWYRDEPGQRGAGQVPPAGAGGGRGAWPQQPPAGRAPFGGLVSVVNGVGGVNMCLPTALPDYDSGANLPAGCHTLGGAQALAFVRDRHSFADEDLQREQDQRAFLRALLAKATSPQEPYLCPGTVRDAIACGRPGCHRRQRRGGVARGGELVA